MIPSRELSTSCCISTSSLGTSRKLKDQPDFKFELKLKRLGSSCRCWHLKGLQFLRLKELFPFDMNDNYLNFHLNIMLFIWNLLA